MISPSRPIRSLGEPANPSRNPVCQAFAVTNISQTGTAPRRRPASEVSGGLDVALASLFLAMIRSGDVGRTSLHPTLPRGAERSQIGWSLPQRRNEAKLVGSTSATERSQIGWLILETERSQFGWFDLATERSQFGWFPPRDGTKPNWSVSSSRRNEAKLVGFLLAERNEANCPGATLASSRNGTKPIPGRNDGVSKT
jgi:hypothetical protein